MKRKHNSNKNLKNITAIVSAIAVVAIMFFCYFYGQNSATNQNNEINSENSSMDNSNLDSNNVDSNLFEKADNNLEISLDENQNNSETNQKVNNNSNNTQNTDNIFSEQYINDERAKFYFLDVGQGDSELIISKNETMLIDAGPNDYEDKLVNDLKKLNITKINYLIGTHPHEDHIGGMDKTIENFEVDKIMMPKIQTNTKTFENVLDAVKNKGLKISTPNVGDKFNVGDVSCEIMEVGTGSKKEQEKNLNLSSIIIEATIGEKKFLFTGDATNKNEEARDWSKVNVLKVAHHGSLTSSSKNFIEKVKPEIAIIEVGKDNDYKLPKSSIIKRIQSVGAKIFRTDENGTILILCDGNNLEIVTER